MCRWRARYFTSGPRENVAHTFHLVGTRRPDAWRYIFCNDLQTEYRSFRRQEQHSIASGERPQSGKIRNLRGYKKRASGQNLLDQRSRPSAAEVMISIKR